MDASQTILFSDLDGTLFSSDGSVSFENRNAIERYIKAGGLFAISTGRLPENALVYLKDLPINGPSVVLNGGACYDFHKKEYSYTRYLDRSTTDPLFHHLIRYIPNLDLQLCTPHGIIYLTPEETAQPTLLSLHRPCQFLKWNDVTEEKFFKALIYAPQPFGDMLRYILSDYAPNRYTSLTCSTDIGGRMYYSEVMPLGVSKGDALEHLRSDPACKGRTFFAVGDFWNDYDLVTNADIGIAVANAIPELKSVADRLTVSNNESAIAHIIDKIIPEL